MTLEELLKSVAGLVTEREIINHGTIRCLLDQEAVECICCAEGIDEVDTDEIGDDQLTQDLWDLINQPNRLLSCDYEELIEALYNLKIRYRGDTIGDYLEPNKEDELCFLEDLITATQEFINILS